jgi:hypothetical protein
MTIVPAKKRKVKAILAMHDFSMTSVFKGIQTPLDLSQLIVICVLPGKRVISI